MRVESPVRGVIHGERQREARAGRTVLFPYATRAAKGARSYQEDSAHVRGSAGGGLTAVLADGMGGHAGGAVASELASTSFLDAFASASGEAVTRLAEALDRANAAIAGKAAESPDLRGMGCTLIGADFAEERMDWVSVGDSPLYLVRDGAVTRLNADHSLAPELDRLAAMGVLTWDEAKADPRRHVLRSALTGTEIDMVDWSREPLLLKLGDIVILASDGIHTIPEAEIARVAAAAETPEAVAEALLAAVAAADDPYQDNVTVVVVRAA
jgi:protein phosphatase